MMLRCQRCRHGFTRAVTPCPPTGDMPPSEPTASLLVPPSPSADGDDPGSPFHAGEKAIQTRVVGNRDRIEEVARRIIRPFMPDEHRDLFAALPWLIMGSLDGQRRPWASILVGPPGFLRSPDPRTLEIHARPGHGDPAAAHLAVGVPVGLLGIQLETRRRNRMNGTVIDASDEGLVVHVDQSYGNCPKYIQARRPLFALAEDAGAEPRPEASILSERAAALVDRADTFFIATASPEARGHGWMHGVDVSHRGGKPGFVRRTEALGRTVLTWPDFSGNLIFNTIGNLVENPRAGVIFIDFESGDLLSLTGDAGVIWEGEEVTGFAGAERLLQFRVAQGVWIERGMPLRWSEPQPASQLAATGSW
jgi:predicted pyridoxine 5'-phosphate oxidase superfamily flavin-nucleotide-binding protein